MFKTGIKDRLGRDICDGDAVSLSGNTTADNSLGVLPNGWHFEADDIYTVYFDDRISTWSLKLDVDPDSSYNAKYMSHAVGLLHDGAAQLVYAQPSAQRQPPDWRGLS